MAGKSLNMQNVPVRDDIWKIKKLFVAPPGYWMVAADYSQIELRMLAYLTQDPELLAACDNDYDLHSFVASSYSGYSYDIIVANKGTDKKYYIIRADAKTIGFGWVYGAADGKFAKIFGSLEAEIKAKIAYFERFNQIMPWKKRELKKFYKTGYAETILGRRRPIPEILQSKLGRFQQYEAERKCINTLVQSPASDYQGKSSANLQVKLRTLDAPEVKFCRVKNMVHDSNFVYAPKDHLEEILFEIKKEMLTPKFGIDVKMAIDIDVGQNWMELKEDPYYTWSGSDYNK